MTSYVVWLGDGGTDKKTGEGAGGGRVKDAAIFFGSDVDGQDQKYSGAKKYLVSHQLCKFSHLKR